MPLLFVLMHSYFVSIVTFSMKNCSASIEILNGSNFKKWKKDLDFSLGFTDLDMTLSETILVINA